MWGDRWDELLRKDTSGKLIQLMNETLDGDYQTFKSRDATGILKRSRKWWTPSMFIFLTWWAIFLPKDMTDDEIWALNRGGHDPKKVFAAFQKAKDTQNKPTVIQPAPAKIPSNSLTILPLPVTGPSRRCKLQLTTKHRLSNFSRTASINEWNSGWWLPDI